LRLGGRSSRDVCFGGSRAAPGVPWPLGRTSCAHSLPLHIHVLLPGHTRRGASCRSVAVATSVRKRRSSAFGSLCPLQVASRRFAAVASHARPIALCLSGGPREASLRAA